MKNHGLSLNPKERREQAYGATLTDIPSLLFMSGYGEAEVEAADLARRQMRVVENDVRS